MASTRAVSVPIEFEVYDDDFYKPCVVASGSSMEEYLAFEQQQQDKHEFHNGDIIKMPGASPLHEALIALLIATLVRQVQKHCTVYSSNLKVAIPLYKRVLYPDISVVCGNAIFEQLHGFQLTNPTLIIEVLSPSTAGYDLTDKFEYYRSLASLEELAFFAQDRPHVEHFRRNPSSGKWEVMEVQNATVELRSVQATVSFADVYTMF